MKIRITTVLLALLILSSSLSLSGCEKTSVEDEPSSVPEESSAVVSEAESRSEEELTLDIGDDPNVIFLVGDVDDSFEVNSQDALMILRAAVGMETFEKNARILADIDKDSTVTSSDALEVLRYSVGMSENDEIGNPYSTTDIKAIFTPWEESVPEDFDGHILTFDSNGGSEVRTQLVPNGGITNMPLDPKKDGYVFDGWYKSEDDFYPFGFGGELNEDTTLYARWADMNFFLQVSDYAVIIPVSGEGARVRLTLATLEDAPDGITVRYGQKDHFDNTAVLLDNASEENGDDIRGDGVYSGYVTLYEPDAFIYFSAELGAYKSNYVKVHTIAALAEGEVSDITIINDEFIKLEESEGYTELTEDERLNAGLKIIEKYSDEGLITDYQVTEEIIAYTTKSGVSGAFCYGDYFLFQQPLSFDSKRNNIILSGDCGESSDNADIGACILDSISYFNNVSYNDRENIKRAIDMFTDTWQANKLLIENPSIEDYRHLDEYKMVYFFLTVFKLVFKILKRQNGMIIPLSAFPKVLLTVRAMIVLIHWKKKKRLSLPEIIFG